MIKQDYWKIQNLTVAETIKASIEIDAEHAIFKGHFPDNPILPGACMVDMVSEVLMKVNIGSLQLYKADQIKFLALMNPEVEAIADLEINVKEQTEHTISISAKMMHSEQVFFKFSGVYNILGVS